jgi:hypothetical protein
LKAVARQLSLDAKLLSHSAALLMLLFIPLHSIHSPPHSPQLVAKFFAKGATAKFATFHHSSLLSHYAYFYASNPFSVTFFACTTSPAA